MFTYCPAEPYALENTPCGQVHGVNVASEVLSRASRGRLTSWTVLDAIGCDPATIHVPRATLFNPTVFHSAVGTPSGSVGKLPFVVGAGPLPDVASLPSGPTPASNWLVPNHVCIGACPEDRREIAVRYLLLLNASGYLAGMRFCDSRMIVH